LVKIGLLALISLPIFKKGKKIMNKKFLLISLLYMLPNYINAVAHTVCEPIPLEIPLLGTLDHIGINVSKIVEFQGKVDALIKHVLKAKGQAYMLVELVNLEELGELDADLIKKLYDMYTKKFLQISHTYFNDIRHLKPVLVKVLSIWAHQRNRTDSLVLLWATIENGKEEQFVKEYTPTLKAFYTFLVDIDMLLQDIMRSCPKSYAKYLEYKKLVEEQHHK
jgi:hypothetical protein